MVIKFSRHGLERLRGRVPGGLVSVKDDIESHLEDWQVVREGRNRISFESGPQGRRFRFVLAEERAEVFTLITVVRV